MVVSAHMYVKICKYCGNKMIRAFNCPEKQWKAKIYCCKKCKRADKSPYLKKKVNPYG